jgi:hypothetical protein
MLRRVSITTGQSFGGIERRRDKGMPLRERVT